MSRWQAVHSLLQQTGHTVRRTEHQGDEVPWQAVYKADAPQQDRIQGRQPVRRRTDRRRHPGLRDAETQAQGTERAFRTAGKGRGGNRDKVIRKDIPACGDRIQGQFRARYPAGNLHPSADGRYRRTSDRCDGRCQIPSGQHLRKGECKNRPVQDERYPQVLGKAAHPCSVETEDGCHDIHECGCRWVVQRRDRKYSCNGCDTQHP